jgi:hypothetical protein
MAYKPGPTEEMAGSITGNPPAFFRTKKTGRIIHRSF